MRTLNRAAMTTALLVPMFAAPLSAQHYRWDFGINGGYSWYRAMLGSEETGLPDGSGADDVKFEAGWLTGAQIGMWMSPRMGLRLNGTFTERPIVGANMDLLDGNTDADDHLTDINLWSGSLDLMLRLKQPNTEWMGREILPYLALGVGGKWVNPGGDIGECRDAQEEKLWNCNGFRPTEGPNGPFGNTFAIGELKSIMGLVGLGADIRMSPNFALRVEANDRIYKPKVHAAAQDAPNSTVWNLPNSDDNVSQIVHEVGAQIGLHMLAGLARPQVVAVVPAPAPQPAPTPVQPAPTPAAPSESNITVCVIDPTNAAGLRTQNAILVGGRDTLVMVNGTRTPLRSAVGQVMVARNADWYVRGQPLTVTIGTDKLEYLTHQGAVQIEANRLAYLGTVNGYPVYADRDEVADVMDALTSLRNAQNKGDLGTILGERRDVRDELEDVQFIYVPLEPTGCVFQPLRMMEQVRKGKQ